MPMPKHKCTPYCEPEDGVHCLPDLAKPGESLLFWRLMYPQFEVIKSAEEDDVNMALVDAMFPAQSGYGRHPFSCLTQGYLIWVREKAPDV
jgi:hypothetical protein